MFPVLAVTVVATLLAVGLLGWGGRYALQMYRRKWLQRARERFHRRREWLEAEFLQRASKSGKPRGLAWTECDFENGVAFAQDRHSRQLRALVAITIRFEAVPGGGMEHVEAVGNLRAATAVFSYDGKGWRTDGRAVFNLNPSETIKHFRRELRPVE
jgi:hypothetical protein